MWAGKGEGEEIFHLLVHSPNGCNSQVWARVKSGVGNSILVSHRGGKSPGTWSVFRCLPSSRSRELDWKKRDGNANGHSAMGCGGVSSCATMPAPHPFGFKLREKDARMEYEMASVRQTISSP